MAKQVSDRTLYALIIVSIIISSISAFTLLADFNKVTVNSDDQNGGKVTVNVLPPQPDDQTGQVTVTVTP